MAHSCIQSMLRRSLHSLQVSKRLLCGTVGAKGLLLTQGAGLPCPGKPQTQTAGPSLLGIPAQRGGPRPDGQANRPLCRAFQERGSSLLRTLPQGQAWLKPPEHPQPWHLGAPGGGTRLREGPELCSLSFQLQEQGRHRPRPTAAQRHHVTRPGLGELPASQEMGEWGGLPERGHEGRPGRQAGRGLPSGRHRVYSRRAGGRSDGERDEAVVALDVPLEDLGAGPQHTLKAGPVQLHALEGPPRHHRGRPGPIQEKRDLP